MMSEEKKTPRVGRELLPEELEQVVGGELSDGEINEYLSRYDDPDIRNAWKYAIGILRNYEGWDRDRYAGIANGLAGHLIDAGYVKNIPQQQLQRILL